MNLYLQLTLRNNFKVLLTLLFAFFVSGGNALAQQESDDEGTVLEEILVTATKTGATSLQNTPIAITAFTGGMLEKTMITDLRDLSQLTIGLTISENTSYAQLYMRGVGSNNVFAGADPSTTIHVDGVYIARPQASFNNFLDIERIEVLRGPQGTLYGRNSVGGTINIISRKPSLDEVDYKAEVVGGNYGLLRFDGYLTGPVSENIALSIAANISNRDGYRKNVTDTGNDLQDEDVKSVRIQALYKGSSIEAILRADYYDEDNSAYGYSTFIEPPPTPLSASIFGDFGKVSNNLENTYTRENSGISLDLSGDINDTWSWNSLTAYRANDVEVIIDSDASELNILRTNIREDQDQVSQEFTFLGDLENSTLLLGAYYFQEDIVQGPGSIKVYPLGIERRPEPIVDTSAWAIFGQWNYRLSERLSLTAGGRYTEEEKTFTKIDGVYLLDTEIKIVDLDFPKESATYSDFTPKLGVEFQQTEDVMYYGSISKGFKSGGFNFTAVLPGGYGPEELWAYEIGIKSRFADDRAQLNLAAFHYDYDDLQVQSFIVPGQVDISNAATATVDGIEVESLFNPTPDLLLWFNIAYLDAVYDEYPEAPIGAGDTFNASGFKLNSAPEWSGSLGANWDHEIGAGSIFLRGEYNWQSEIFFTPDNNEVERQGSYALVNVFLGYTNSDGRWSVELWGRNLFDEDYISSSASFTLVRAGTAGAPATYGVRLTLRK